MVSFLRFWRTAESPNMKTRIAVEVAMATLTPKLLEGAPYDLEEQLLSSKGVA
jgi:hypothetical protein